MEEIFQKTYYTNTGSKDTRNYIKTEDGIVKYSIYLAKQNPDICGEYFSGCNVHHIDGNCLNDVPSNLICLDPKTHAFIHSINPVNAYKGSNFIGRFWNYKECADELGISPVAVSYYCRNHKPLSSKYKEYRFSPISLK